MIEFEEDLDKDKIHYDENRHTKVAKKLLRWSIAVFIIDLFIYIMDMLSYSYIDFGFCFEFASLILVICSLIFIKLKDIQKAKIASMLSLAPLILLLIYDIIMIVVFDGIYAIISFLYLAESLSVLLIILIIASYTRLAKVHELSEGAIDTNWFYEDK